VIGRNEYRDKLLLYRKDFGGILSPKHAWSFLTYGLPTVAIRQKKAIESAQKIARYLENHPKIDFVNYPGLPTYKYHELAKKQMTNFDGEFAPGHLIYFVLKGADFEQSREKGRNFMNHIADNAYTITLAVSLGHTRTLIEHPATMTHSVVPTDQLGNYGLHAGGVRIAVGLEKAEDIIKDLEESLNAI
jgi:methionine-gamma-lyase